MSQQQLKKIRKEWTWLDFVAIVGMIPGFICLLAALDKGFAGADPVARFGIVFYFGILVAWMLSIFNIDE